MVGAYLIFRFGLPEKIDREGSIQVIVGKNEEEIHKVKKYDLLAKKVGVPFLMIGFFLQFVSNYLNE